MSVGSALAVALALGVTGLVGAAAVSFFTSGLLRAERWAWSFAAGLMVQSGLLLFAAAGGLSPRRAFMLAGDALIVAVGALLGRGRAPSAATPARVSECGPFTFPLLVVAGAACLLFTVLAIAEPMWATDYLAIWGMKGKVIYETQTLPARLFRDPALYWAHREYPLLLPLALASLAGIAGEWNDQALALLFPAAAAATLLLLYGFLSRRVSKSAGAIAALLSALCFGLYRPANAGTAEVPFALGAVLAACAVLDLLERRGAEVRGRVALAALFCASIKQEGTLWIVLLAVSYLFARGIPRWKRADWLAIGVLSFPPTIHWVLLYLLRGPQTRRDFDFQFLEANHWAALVSRLAAVCARIATVEMREAVLPLLAIALFLLITRPAFADAILPALAAQILFYCVAFSISSFDPMYAVDGAFRRIALTLFPALALVLGARFSSGWLPETNRPEQT